MNTMVILVCALAIQPPDCDERTARIVIRGGHTEGVMCALAAQTKLARTPLVKSDEYLKVECIPNAS